MPKDSAIHAWFPHTIWATIIPIGLLLGGTVIIATLVTLIMWKADRDTRRRKNAPEAKSKVPPSANGAKEKGEKDVASPVKRGKTKAS